MAAATRRERRGRGRGERRRPFSIYIGEPENPLVPGNTTESEGSQVVDSLWTGLVQYAATARCSTPVSPTSIESEDATTWTVTLKDGWTFHDGTPVDRRVLRQRLELHGAQHQRAGCSYFFANVEGYDALQAETDDAGNVVATRPRRR